MRLLIYVPQMAAYGGMERHLCLLSVCLATTGQQVVLVTTSNSLNETSRHELLDAGVELRELAVARGDASKVRKLWWLFWTSVRMRFRSWDIIYTNGQSGLAAVVWWAAGKDTRIVHHHHTAGDAAEQQTWHSAFRRTLATAPELVTCSAATKQHLELALGRRDAVFIPYLTPEIFPSTAVVEKIYPANAPIDIGFVGRLVSTKGIDIICALSDDPALPAVRWHIHGSGEDYPASHFEPYQNIQFHGTFSGPGECAVVFGGLDAVALFSRHNEGMPLSLIEAMSAGLPWIATDQGGTRELAIVAENCEVVSAHAPYEEIRSRTLALVNRIRSGQTSRTAQRRAYDANFAPKVAASRWLEFLSRSRVP